FPRGSCTAHCGVTRAIPLPCRVTLGERPPLAPARGREALRFAPDIPTAPRPAGRGTGVRDLTLARGRVENPAVEAPHPQHRQLAAPREGDPEPCLPPPRRLRWTSSA